MKIELSTYILLVQDNPPFLRCFKNCEITTMLHSTILLSDTSYQRVDPSIISSKRSCITFLLTSSQMFGFFEQTKVTFLFLKIIAYVCINSVFSSSWSLIQTINTQAHSILRQVLTSTFGERNSKIIRCHDQSTVQELLSKGW